MELRFLWPHLAAAGSGLDGGSVELLPQRAGLRLRLGQLPRQTVPPLLGGVGLPMFWHRLRSQKSNQHVHDWSLQTTFAVVMHPHQPRHRRQVEFELRNFLVGALCRLRQPLNAIGRAGGRLLQR